MKEKFAEIPIELTDDYCTAGYEFCIGTCNEYEAGYHSSNFLNIPGKWRQPLGGGPKATELAVSVYQRNRKKRRGKRRISLIATMQGHEITLTPHQAFQLAQSLLGSVEKAVGDGGSWK